MSNQRPRAPEGEGTASPARPRALLVEDDAAVGRAIGRLLRSVGFEVVVTPSAIAALQGIRQGARFHLVVSDVRMPGLDGPSFRIAARELWPEIDDVLIFVSGAWDSRDSPLRGFQKPLAREFLECVRGVFREAVARDAG